MDIVETYPFGASKSVFWGNLPSPYPPTLAVVSYGGGLRILDTSVTNDPEPWVSSGEDSELRTSGFVRQVIVAPENGDLAAAIYCASGVGFVSRFPIGPIEDEPTYELDPTSSATFNAHCVAVYDDLVGTDKRYILAGSHDGQIGRVSIAVEQLNPTTALIQKATYATASPVIALAVTDEVRTGYLVVLAGTLCGGLYRFDLDLSTLSSMSAFPTPSTILTPGTPPYTSIRDIAIHPTSSPPRAFLASYAEGIHAVDLSTSSNSMSLPGAGWPLTFPGQTYYCTGVSLHRGGSGDPVPTSFLFAAFAGREQQVEWGQCSKPSYCGTEQRIAEPSKIGVSVIQGILGTNPGEVGAWVEEPTEKVAFRRYGTSFWLIAANDVDGASFILAEQAAPLWAVSTLGDYGHDDGIPTSSTNDSLILNQGGTQVIYDAVELGIATHTLGSGIDVLQGYTSQGGIVLSGLPNGSSGLGGVIIASALSSGITAFDPDPSSLTPGFLGAASTQGRCYSAQITGNSLDGQGLPWVYALNSLDFSLSTPALRAFRLTVLTSPPTLRAISSPWNDSQSREVRMLAIRPLDSTRHAAFMSYGPTSGGAAHGGIVMVEMTYDANSNPPLSMVEKGTIRACESPGNPCPYGWDSGPGRVLLGTGNRIYAALGCNGVMMADVDSSFSVSNQAWWAPCPTGGPECATALGLADGLTINGTPYLIVTYLNDVDSLARGTIRLFDTSSASAFQAGPAATFSARYQGVGVVKDPTDSQGKTFYIAEGRGGLSKVVFGP